MFRSVRLLLVVAGLLITTGQSYGTAGETLSVAKVEVGLQTEPASSSTLAVVSFSTEELFKSGVELTLKEYTPDYRPGSPAINGTLYQAEQTAQVVINKERYEFTVRASQQELASGELTPYTVSLSGKKAGSARSYSLAVLTVKSPASLDEVVSVSGWGKDKFSVGNSDQILGQLTGTLYFGQ